MPIPAHWLDPDPTVPLLKGLEGLEERIATLDARLATINTFRDVVDKSFGTLVGQFFKDAILDSEQKFKDHESLVEEKLLELDERVQERRVNIQVLEAQIECLREDRDELARANHRDRKVYLRRRKREHATTVSVTTLLAAASAMIVIVVAIYAV
jgi:DNA repair exonuclease SbcCD ATPase subunit